MESGGTSNASWYVSQLIKSLQYIMVKLTIGSCFLQKQSDLCSFSAKLSSRGGLPGLSLLSATLLPKRTRMVTHRFCCFNCAYGSLSIACFHRIWPVYLTASTLWRGDLGWFWSLDIVCHFLISPVFTMLTL